MKLILNYLNENNVLEITIALEWAVNYSLWNLFRKNTVLEKDKC
jgi:hypothetical protein